MGTYTPEFTVSDVFVRWSQLTETRQSAVYGTHKLQKIKRKLADGQKSLTDCMPQQSARVGYCIKA